MTVVDHPAPATAADQAHRAPVRGVGGGPAVVGTVLGVGLLAALLTVLVVALVVGGATPVDAVPFARLATRIAALGTVGTVLFAAVLRPAAPLPGASRWALPESSRRALRTASAWATAWAAATVVHALLTLAQIAGPSVTGDALRIFVADLPAGRAALVVLVAAAIVAVAARPCTIGPGAAGLLVVAAVGLVVPTVLTGHASAADDPLLTVTGLSVHVLAASIWVGGLLALLVHGRGPDDLVPAATRFSAVALVCFLATGASGLLVAWPVLDGSADLAAALGSGYGLLLLAKTAALVALGLLGWQHRRQTLPRLRSGAPGSFRRFAVVETTVMLATVVLAVALSSSPPPAAASSAAPSAGIPSVATTQPPLSPAPAAGAMAGHDHGELSVGVLIDETRFHVGSPVVAGSRVTVFNGSDAEVTITAEDGSFDVVVPANALITFPAPEDAGSYAFASRHDPAFSDVLVVG